MQKKIILTMAAILLASTSVARATSFKVSSPYIEAGKTKVEWQGYYGVDDDDRKNTAWKQNFILGYGVSQYWKTQIKTVYEKGGEGDDPDVTVNSFENTFAFSKPGENFFDTAVKIDYAHFYSGDIPDNLATKLIVAKTTDNFQHIINLKIARDIGSDSDFNGGFAWSSKYKYSNEVQPGIELYNDFGSLDKHNAFRNQNRSIGPVLNGRVHGIDYQAGYLFGLTDDTPQGTVKISIGYQF